jgi:pimeloyl-ACP methyl ester carboxylesterase
VNQAQPSSSLWPKRLAWTLLALFFVLYSFLNYRVWRDQERMLFPVFGPDYTECKEILALGFTPKRVERDGEVVRMLWRKGKKAKGTVLMFHGNGGTVCYRTFYAQHLVSEDWNVALAEYPGYGPNSGVASEASILSNALAAYDVAQVEGKKLPVIVYGESLGSGPATYVGAKREPAALVLHTPYPSLTAVSLHFFHYLLPVGLWIRHPMRAERWAPDVICPVLALHGDADTLIPIRLGRREASHFKNLRFVTIPGADHNDVATRDLNAYWVNLRIFCEQVLAAKPKAP